MDISKIGINFVESFDTIYKFSSAVFDVKPESASPKIQKKIRKWIEKNPLANTDYPARVMKFIDKEVSDEDFFGFLKACHDRILREGTRKQQLFEKFSSDLTDDVKDAIWSLLDHDTYCNIYVKGNNAEITVENCEGFSRTLTLLDAHGVPDIKFDCLSFENGSLCKSNGEYTLLGEAENYADDVRIPFAIRFTEAKVSIAVYRADTQLYNGTPWMHLHSVAATILDKYFLPGDHLNDPEKELLPLLCEIGKLSLGARIPQEYDNAEFPILRSYISNLKYSELLIIIEQLEKDYTNAKIKDKLSRKLFSLINTKKYEPLWRALYSPIAESQAEYPKRAEVCCKAELLTETRSIITRLMEAHGYTGSYPDFVKKGSVGGIRLAESYDLSYFVGAEKNVMFRIHCTEEYFNGHLTVQFICGTEFLRKNEAPGDIYSCLFNAKGRRLYQTVNCSVGCFGENGEDDSDNLSERVGIAVKRAELIKLTKEERCAVYGNDAPVLRLFLSVFIIMGGMYSILMILAGILLSVIACLVFGQPETVPTMLTEMPWLALLLLAWVLFGGIMGIVTVLVKRR